MIVSRSFEVVAVVATVALVAPPRDVAKSASPAIHTAAAPVADSLDVSDLPLIELPASRPGGRVVALFLTGDGGWAGLDRKVAEVLAERGVAVVGLDARAYLSRRKATPDIAARDVGRILRHYMQAWGRDRIALVGYSRGADMLPFVAARLPSELRTRLSLVAMLGLATTASFEFHWSDLLKDTERPTDRPVAPELERLRGTRMLCVYGTEEKNSLCRAADPALVTKVERPGEHHFDSDYRALGVLVADALQAAPAGAP